MSAVIWCGIVAVWIFVLIPTWVRRGDLHWHRGNVGPTVGTAVVAEGLDEKSSGRAGHSERATGRRLLRRSRDVSSIEVEAMAEQDAQSPEQTPVYASAPRARVAAAPSSGRLGSSVRASFGTGPKGSGRKKPALRVRRARRLVGLAALALGTLIAAIAGGGLFIALNIVCDIALILYVRHLRNAARARSARAAREKRARVARQAWEEASSQDRASHLDGWSAASAPVLPGTEPYEAPDVPYVDEQLEYADGELEYAESEYADGEYAEAGAPAEIDLNAVEQPALIDLTDAPTEELAAAQAS
ncbi:MAG TPA: hypothetical protein VHX15_17670 [Frankiaceae bacterium]|jgi:hypothetical protein|nr:hypothetical protein [Frankiaceae bacterium]